MGKKLLQWVNLVKDDKFKEDEVTSKERMGPLHFEVKFKQPKSAEFKVKVVPKGNKNAVYSPRELTFDEYKIVHTRTHNNAAKTQVKLFEDVQLPASGGDTFEIHAKYHKKVIQGKRTVESRRKLYYELLTMLDGFHPEHYVAGPGAKNSPCVIGTPDTTPVEDQYKAQFFILKKTGGATFAFRQNVNSNDPNQRWGIVRAAAKAWTSAKYEPFAFACVFANQLADQKEEQLSETVSGTYTLPAGALSLGSTEITHALPPDYYLWYGLDDADDKNREFLAKNGCKFIDSAGKPHDIPDINVSVDTSVGPPYTQLKIKIPWSIKAFFSKSTGKIRIKLRLIDGFCGGYSEPSYNFIIIAKRAWFWTGSYSDAQQVQIVVHESGHKVGMVPYGGKVPAAKDYFGGGARQLDAPAKLYGEDRPNNSKDHCGPHCETATAWTAPVPPATSGTWTGVPGCVMWGATSYTDAAGVTTNTTPNFCGDCKKLVRKLNLNATVLPGLNNSLTKC